MFLWRPEVPLKLCLNKIYSSLRTDAILTWHEPPQGTSWRGGVFVRQSTYYHRQKNWWLWMEQWVRNLCSQLNHKAYFMSIWSIKFDCSLIKKSIMQPTLSDILEDCIRSKKWAAAPFFNSWMFQRARQVWTNWIICMEKKYEGTFLAGLGLQGEPTQNKKNEITFVRLQTKIFITTECWNVEKNKGIGRKIRKEGGNTLSSWAGKPKTFNKETRQKDFRKKSR